MATKRKISTSAANEQDRAAGFLNIKVRLTNGKEVSLGKFGLGLFADRKVDAAIMRKLEADPSFIEDLKENLILNYNPVTNEDDSEELDSLLDF